MTSPRKQHRYPGINPFTAQEENIFFGREEDQQHLLSLIHLEKLIVLFAKSGYGKTSLLNAGIAPALIRKALKGKCPYLPIFVRFNTWDQYDKRSWMERFLFHFDQQSGIRDTGASTAPDRSYLPRTLWGELKRRYIGREHFYVLIFDQFEEFFSYPIEQQEAFKQQLAELLYAEIPAFVEQHETELPPSEVRFLSERILAKAVLSIRSDRLGELHSMKDRLPAILHKRYELTALTEGQAREALEKPASLEGEFLSPPFSFSRQATDLLIRQLADGGTDNSTGIEAFQLQIIAQEIENRVIQGRTTRLDKQGRPVIYREDLPQLDNIYAQYYHRKIKELAPAQRLPARMLIEDGLLFVDAQGQARRISMDGGLLCQQFAIDTQILKALEDTFLLRREVNSMQGYNYELSHDTLVSPVLEARRQRDAETEKKKIWKRQKNLMIWIFTLVIAMVSVSFFAAWALRQRNNAQDLAKERENLLIRNEQTLRELKKAQAQRIEQEFNEVYRRTENEIKGEEYELARQDIGVLQRLFFESAQVEGDTAELKQRLLNIRQQLNDHEK